MSLQPPLTDLPIKTDSSGYYEGFNRMVTICGKAILAILVIWALVFPSHAAAALGSLQGLVMANFSVWYMIVMGAFFIVSFGLAVLPASGQLKLSSHGEDPEFSSFSWFSMMFSAGIGVGMLTYATAEPLYHFQNNPEVIQGLTTGATVDNVASGAPADNVRSAYKWSFLHWGVTAWCCYSLIGLSLAYFSYRRDLPLTIRSGITSLFGKSLSGTFGNIVDISAVVATILGVAVTLGVGVNQFASAIYKITGADWLLNDLGEPIAPVIIVSIMVIMFLSTISALSGVGKGIKWLSNTNMALSCFVLIFLMVFGSTAFAFKAFFFGLWDYIINFPSMMLTKWTSDGNPESEISKLAGWQSGWTIFYWAWWVAFAPFVGLFLARVSRGRTVREFVIGSAIVPGVMCFVWFTVAGGTAINLELTGEAGGAILNAPATQQLFETMGVLLSPNLAWCMWVIIFVLLLTYLVTTVDSAILIVNTINAAGDASPKRPIHIISWGIALGLVMASLLLLTQTDADGNTISGLKALTSAMIVGALPFSAVMMAMCFALVKAILRDSKRLKEGVPSTIGEMGEESSHATT
ncbi:BCCT family transporter [Roseovarius sp. EL26]|uniref:BCCT family transporter n=1 Tax=Roseovarius sp. EL26 TaxID=2126672 RepID=UPI000EA08826|nr:BCCT family transporter [Roseovarius sp. EL26]